MNHINANINIQECSPSLWSVVVWFQTESLWNHTTTDHKGGEQLEDRRNIEESSCNFGDGTDQMVQSLMFMMMMMMMTNGSRKIRHLQAYIHNFWKLSISHNKQFFFLCFLFHPVCPIGCCKRSIRVTSISYSDNEGVWMHKVISVVRSLVFRVVKQRELVVTDVSGLPILPIFKGPAVWTAGPLKTGRIRYSETPVTKYQFTTRNIPEERRSHLRRDGCLKSRTILLMLVRKTCVRLCHVCSHLCPTYDFWLTPILASAKNFIERPRQ